jgi:hypothetical protein
LVRVFSVVCYQGLNATYPYFQLVSQEEGDPMKTLNFTGIKERHQKEAAERKAVSDAMTPQQRLAYLDEHNFTATKERARLKEIIAGGGKKKQAKTETVVVEQKSNDSNDEVK